MQVPARCDSAIVRPQQSKTAVLYSRLAEDGDILLTRGRAISSAMTAALTKGEFSHAAIVSAPFLFESLTKRGVGATQLRAVTLKRPDIRAYLSKPIEQQYGLLLLPPADMYLLLRHPGLRGRFAPFEAHDLLAEVAKAAQYPTPSALVDTLDLPAPMLGALRQMVVGIESLLQVERHLPGPFCSELAAIFFDTVGAPLFTPPREPASVSPNSLLESNLDPVFGAIALIDDDDLDSGSTRSGAGINPSFDPGDQEVMIKRLARITELTKLMEKPKRRWWWPFQTSRETEMSDAALESTRIANDIIATIASRFKATADQQDVLLSDEALQQEIARNTRPFGIRAWVVGTAGARTPTPLHEAKGVHSPVIHELPYRTEVLTHLQRSGWWEVKTLDGTTGFVPQRCVRYLGPPPE